MSQGVLLHGLSAGFVGLRRPSCCSLELNVCKRLGTWPVQIFDRRCTGSSGGRRQCRGSRMTVKAVVDPWAPGASVDSQSISSSLFAGSLFPYLGFLYHLTKSKTSPPMTLFGFYFLLVFVGVTIPAGIYAKVHYGTSLANVDWLHGGAESFLTLTNLFIVLGLRSALQTPEMESKRSEVKTEEEKAPVSE
ncbi:hypothetical protein R1sor_007088 [Riccia sorocarpa]|uniref:Uncharacterized protein n=1 Tax=Riccia sorocarpa TaxID=122646 RepID=A0ABD3HPE9_9MARC